MAMTSIFYFHVCPDLPKSRRRRRRRRCCHRRRRRCHRRRRRRHRCCCRCRGQNSSLVST